MGHNALRGWRTDYVLWVEVFALANLAFLALDIFLAHSENGFLRRAEYVPLFFSMAAPILLITALWARYFGERPLAWKVIGYAVGAVSIGLGLSGVVYHLDSQFFYERTIRSLTYAAPFVAPLAYTGVGMLLLLNRMEPVSTDWARWIVFLTMAASSAISPSASRTMLRMGSFVGRNGFRSSAAVSPWVSWRCSSLCR